jgi:hypothetical protein
MYYLIYIMYHSFPRRMFLRFLCVGRAMGNDEGLAACGKKSGTYK